MARLQTVRFVHPWLDGGGDDVGLRVGVTGGLENAQGAAAIRQALLLLLSTEPGERVMRPGYGCELSKLAFSPNDATTAGLAMHFVRRAIETWEPRIEILNLDANRHPQDPGRLDIALQYRIRQSYVVDRVDVPLWLQGSAR